MVDVTDIVTAENNDLEIGIVNLWPNRPIGSIHRAASVRKPEEQCRLSEIDQLTANS